MKQAALWLTFSVISWWLCGFLIKKREKEAFFSSGTECMWYLTERGWGGGGGPGLDHKAGQIPPLPFLAALSPATEGPHRPGPKLNWEERGVRLLKSWKPSLNTLVLLT